MHNNTSKLSFLQKLSENELCQLVLIPLFEAQKYTNIRYTHGALERGKDIIFTEEDPFGGLRYFSVVVKSSKLSGSVSSSKGIREVWYQIEQSLEEPYVDPYKGNTIKINSVLMITPYPISNQAILSIEGKLQTHQDKIRFIDGPMLLTLLDKFIPDIFTPLSDPNMKYLDMLIQRLSHNGSQFLSSKSRSIIDLYTPSSLSFTSVEKAKSISFTQPTISDHTFLSSDILDKNKINKSKVILADVGAGKTTLLQNLAIQIAQTSSEETINKDFLIPIFISLHLLPKKSFLSLEKFDEEISLYLGKREIYYEYEESIFQRFILFLDGFDEISAGHAQIENIIIQLHNRYGGLVLTSRPSRIPLLNSSFDYIKLEPFTNENILLFLDKWFTNNFQTKDKLWEKIQSNSTLLMFVRTPLMLTLYSLLADNTPIEKLPIRRTDIYSMITKQLLGNWDDMRNIKSEYSRDEKEIILENIALFMHKKNLRYFSSYELYKICSDIGILKNEFEIEILLNELIYRSSLIKPSDITSDTFEFVHLSFQEYFAAKSLTRVGDIQLLKGSLFNNWYRGVWVFYFGIKRNMEEVKYFKKKIFQNNGLRIMEYLLEADYTNKKLKSIFLQYICIDILNTSKLSSFELALCKKINSELLDELEKLLNNKPERYTNINNFFTIAFFINSNKARELVFYSYHLLKYLSFNDLKFLITSISKWKIEKNDYFFLEELCDSLENNVIWKNLISANDIKEELTSLNNYLSKIEKEYQANISQQKGLIHFHTLLQNAINNIKKKHL